MMAENTGKDVPQGKPILCLDFDGVIHSYTSGWQGIDVIPDPPVPGAMAFLAEAVKHFEVHIFSSRSKNEYAISEMIVYIRKNLRKEGFPVEIADKIVFPTEKPAAFITIDDRAITFTGKWPSMKELLNFKPWYKLGIKVSGLDYLKFIRAEYIDALIRAFLREGAKLEELELVQYPTFRDGLDVVSIRRRSQEPQPAFKAIGEPSSEQLARGLMFYKIRVEAIEKIKDELPEPYRTMVINILANGKPEP